MYDLPSFSQALESSLISKRKAICENILDVLSQKDIINSLNAKPNNWNNLFDSLKICIEKDAQKVENEVTRRPQCSFMMPPSCDAFYNFINVAFKEGTHLNVSNVVNYILGCLKIEKIRRCYEVIFLDTLEKLILSNNTLLGQFDNQLWSVLYNDIKRKIVTSETIMFSLSLRCFVLIVKNGPLYGLELRQIRDEHTFFIKISEKFDSDAYRSDREHLVEILCSLTRHTAKDFRTSCCYLGEETINSLYQYFDINARFHCKFNELIFEYFILQVNLHHPQGAENTHKLAYAYDWCKWKNCIQVIYNLLNNLIEKHKVTDIKQSYNTAKSTSKWIEGTVLRIKHFIPLFVQVTKLLLTWDDSSSEFSDDGPPKKRLKTNLTFISLVENIPKTFLWILLVSSLLEYSPQLITEHEYLALLKILSKILLETKNTDIVNVIYKCLSVLCDINVKSASSEDINTVWRTISDTTLRMPGSSLEWRHLLIRKLIRIDQVQSLDQVLQNYMSGLIGLSAETAETLEVVLDYMNFLKYDIGRKQSLIDCIVGSTNASLSSPLIAKILVGLLFRQWPEIEQSPVICKETGTEFDEITNIYQNTLSLETNIIDCDSQSKPHVDITSFSVDIVLNDYLNNALEMFFDKYKSQSPDILLRFASLLINITDLLIQNNVITKDELDTVSYMRILKDILRNPNLLIVLKDLESTETLNNVLVSLESLFAMDNCLSTYVRELIENDLMIALFDIRVHFLKESEKKKIALNPIEESIMRKTIGCLTDFSVISSNSDLLEIQVFALEVLSEKSYDPKCPIGYEMLVTMFQCLRSCKVGLLPDNILEMFLSSLQDLCESRYECYENAVDILTIFKIIIPHVGLSRLEKSVVVNMLYPFFVRRSHYGPKVSVLILQYIKELFLIDPQGEFSVWGTDIKIFDKVPLFLCHDFQEVRFTAIELLIIMFRRQQRNCDLQKLHEQELIFEDIYQKSLKLFEVDGVLTKYREIDEISTRTACATKIFTSFILNCDLWIEESLFALMKLAYHKKIDSLTDILKTISTHFGIQQETDFLSKYMDYLVNKWINYDHSLQDLPFTLLDCLDKEDFCSKYPEISIPLMIYDNSIENYDYDIESSCTSLFVRALQDDVEYLDNNFLFNSKIMSYLNEKMGQQPLKEKLLKQVENVLLYLLNSVTDQQYIKANFQQTVIFFKKQLNCAQFEKCKQFIESFLLNEKELISSLHKHSLHKVERILLQLELKLCESISFVDKLRSLHHFEMFIDLTVKHLEHTNSDWQSFYIRHCTYSLIHLFNSHITKWPEISVLILKHFKTFLSNILPLFAKIFESFLHFAVNALNTIVLKYPKNKPVQQYSMEILSILIIENGEHMSDVIQMLQNFPHQSQFDRIRTTYLEIKSEIGFLQEIEFFLKIDDTLSSNHSLHDSLKHLKEILSEQKEELSKMYKQPSQKRLLLRLISLLVKLTSSSDEQVRFEAMRCLGEIGPGDLMTPVLQTERSVVNTNCTTIGLLTGHVLVLLSEYIVDADINVRVIASEVLYLVLGSRVGKRVGKSNFDYGGGTLNQSYLHPFLSATKNCPEANLNLKLDLFKLKVVRRELWVPCVETTHKEWLTNLVVNILGVFQEESFLYQLVKVCNKKLEFCETVFPLLIIFLILHFNDESIIRGIIEQIRFFFGRHVVLSKTNENSIVTNKFSVQCMLNLVNFVRLQIASDTRSKVTELDLNYLHVGQAAKFCGAHFSALFYAEYWCRSKPYDVTVFKKQKSLLDSIYEEVNEDIADSLRTTLKNAYKAIGDVDALSGCGISPEIMHNFSLDHCKEFNNVKQVLQLSNIVSTTADLQESLKHCGLFETALKFWDTEPDYECLWRLGQWDFNAEKTYEKSPCPTSQQYDKYKFFTLKAVHDSDKSMFDKMNKSLALCVLDDLQQTSLECTNNFYGILMRLESMIETEDFCAAIPTSSFENVLIKWHNQQNILVSNDFQYFEPILTQRINLLNDYLNRNPLNNGLKMILVDMALNLLEIANSEKQPHVALRTLCFLQNMDDLNGIIKTKIQLNSAKYYWSMNDKSTAHYILNKLGNDENVEPSVRAAALKQSGQWMIETMTGDRFAIVSDYLLKSLKLTRDNGQMQAHAEDVLETYDTVAGYMDQEYQQVMGLIKSDTFQKKKTNMEKSRKEAQMLVNQSQKTSDQRKASIIHERNSNIDQNEIEHTYKTKDNFLQLALKYYMMNIMQSDKNDNRIFRIMALFFENRNNSGIEKLIKELLHQIPSYKFITMLPQLVPHIAETDFFGEQVYGIIERCAIDHPHHTLPLVLSLVNANTDQKYTKSGNNSKDVRIVSAKKLLTSLKKHHNLETLIDNLQFLSEALIELAYKEDSGQKQSALLKSSKIMKVKNFDDVLIPTLNYPVVPSKDYSRIVGIRSFAASYENVGGINTPKRIICNGTNGKQYFQLVKGHDDLRQDAVMQQVFTIMNNLLLTNKPTVKLSIRTYKIVPLSRRSGVLEWVENSVELGRYLIEAHSKHFPNNWKVTKCRDVYKTIINKAQEDKVTTFQKICDNLQPVMHKFFEESFPHPTVWYERRRAYIDSVATASMCGYILGIGDRHVNNILVDRGTAEVIHIDFGIAFEGGRVLPTPETIPFRLTREIVDGMGVAGVEGAFRKSCEKTLQILRKHSQTITTILEVLLYDPLYVWTVSASEANKRQGDRGSSSHGKENDEGADTTSINNSAERALLRLKDKLQGIEDGSPTTIEFQVSKLIHQAMDVNNLCRLFHGWQSYL